jgi:hypothetical protein
MILIVDPSSRAGVVGVVASGAGCDCPRAGAAAASSIAATVATNGSLTPVVTRNLYATGVPPGEAQVGRANTATLSSLSVAER